MARSIARFVFALIHISWSSSFSFINAINNVFSSSSIGYRVRVFHSSSSSSSSMEGFGYFFASSCSSLSSISTSSINASVMGSIGENSIPKRSFSVFRLLQFGSSLALVIFSLEGLFIGGDSLGFVRRFLHSGDVGSDSGFNSLRSSFDMTSLFLLQFFARYKKVESRSAFGKWIFPVFQSTCGLFSVNQGKPKMISVDPKFVTKSLSKNFLLSIVTLIHVN